MDAKHQKHVSIFETGAYESLLVYRVRKQRFFMIRIDGKDEMYVNESGERPSYRHVGRFVNG
jgi:hypothetical protein